MPYQQAKSVSLFMNGNYSTQRGLPHHRNVGQLLLHGRLISFSLWAPRKSPLSPQISDGSSPKTLVSKCTVRVCVALLGLTPAGDVWDAGGVVRCSTEGGSARLEEGAETTDECLPAENPLSIQR